MVDFWGLAGPGGPGDPFKRWGASHRFPARRAPGGPGEGPDCHLPKEIVGFGPIPARILGETHYLFLFGARIGLPS